MLCNGWTILRESPKLCLCRFEPYLGNLSVFLLLAIMYINFLLYVILIYVMCLCLSFLLFYFLSILAFFKLPFPSLLLPVTCSHPKISNDHN